MTVEFLSAVGKPSSSGPAGASRQHRPINFNVFLLGLMFVLLAGAVLVASPNRALAQSEAKAAEGDPLKIAIFVASAGNACKGPGNLSAVTRFTTLAQERLNAIGGIHGKPIEVNIFSDDPGQEKTTVKRVSEFAEDPRSLAILGITKELLAYRAYSAAEDVRKAKIDKEKELAKDEKRSPKSLEPLPLITDAPAQISKDEHPSLFSLVPSRASVRDPVLASFIRNAGNGGYKNVAVVSLKSGLTSLGLSEDTVKQLTDQNITVTQYELTLEDFQADSAKGSARAAVVKAITSANQRPGLIVFAAPTGLSGPLITEISETPKYKPHLFYVEGLLGRPLDFDLNGVDNLMFGFVWENIPEVTNSNLRNLIARDGDDDWVFECNAGGQPVNPDPFYHNNLAAINLGTRYADMINLIAEAVNARRATKQVSSMRAHIKNALEERYLPGQRKFKGIFRNWSFEKKTHSVDRMPFVEIHPSVLPKPQLAPIQFVRLQDGRIEAIDTVYLDIDLIRTHGINDNDKTFFAEFYLAVRTRDRKLAARSTDPAKSNVKTTDGKPIRDKTISQIDRIEFANAYLDPKAPGGRQLTITRLHDGKANPAYPDQMEMYKVSGRFFFDPRLANYPFDVQQFPIEIQPKQADQAFIIQPPPAGLRDTNLVVEGWLPKLQYVGYSADFVPVVDAFKLTPAIVPFYKSSFVWQMKRETTDYFLRVVVPLAFILIVAYLSIFIPQNHMEAIVTIQITALLSAVALYLSLPQLETDTATISDRIFVFDYMMVSVMIIISILRINARIQKVAWMDGLLSFVHITLVPATVAYMAYWVYSVTILQLNS